MAPGEQHLLTDTALVAKLPDGTSRERELAVPASWTRSSASDTRRRSGRSSSTG
jgi:hypothetical protein